MEEDLVTSLTYHPLVIRLVRRLGLRSFLRKWFFWWARPTLGVISVKLGAFDCQFYVRTAEQLRILGKAASGHWRTKILQFLERELRPGDVVYDIGSNIGVCSVFAARRIGEEGRLIAFEPVPITYEHLCDNIHLNRLTNACAFPVALADYTGEASLFFGDDLLFSSLINCRNVRARTQAVRVVEGDQFCREENLPAPDVVMIDVEGFEKGVTTGLTQTLSDPKCRAVIAEIHPTLLPPGVTGESVLDILRSCGFEKIDLLHWSGIPEFYAFALKGPK